MGLETIIFAIVWGLIGTVIGRILFRTRLGNKARYTTDEMYSMSEGHRVLKAYTTEDMASAQTYGLWSIPFWPLTLAIYLVQAPTPKDKMEKRTREFEEATEALEAVAKKYDLHLQFTELRH